MPTVNTKNMPIDKALRLFRKKVEASEILLDYRKKEEYVKPSTARNRAKQAAVRRQKKLREEYKQSRRRR